ncbi:MAG: helix-turn-helix domain-containing protein [Lachnospiraceae bacterium]|nr:helix-turn-helix domain-containing protein [Lachnospiraceae bacterium]
MITKQVIKTTIEELKEVAKVEFSVIDGQGLLMASTCNDLPSTDQVLEFFDSKADSQIIADTTLFKIKDDEEPVFVLAVKGNQSDSYTYGRICVNELRHLLVAYREQFDNTIYFQNLLLDNLLTVDIYNRARKLSIEPNKKRIVYVAEVLRDKTNEAVLALKSAFSEDGDFTVSIDDKNVILIHTMGENEDFDTIEELARCIEEILNTEVMVKTRIAYGTVADDLRQISQSYKEAKMALDVGAIFYSQKTVMAYNALGIGRLIYQLPVNLCKIFTEEVFGDELPEEIDEEVINTINAFLDNNFNVSETARQLYIHRNTLGYRIEKLKQATGLDVREFNDALTYKIALMVSNYVKFMEENNR